MSAYQKPLPVVQPWSREFWEATRQRRFLIQHCHDCHSNIFYPRKACPECWSENLGWTESSGKGTVYSFSVIHEGMEEVFSSELPMILAWIEVEEGIRFLSNLIDCVPEEIQIGDEVEVVFKDVTPEFTMPYFKLVN